MPTTVSTKLWLRTFALIDRETIADERDPTIVTETVRLHRLVREVATARCAGKARDDAFRRLVEAVTAVYPTTVFDDPGTWPRARRLDALALALVHGAPLAGTEALTADLLSRLASHRHLALGAMDTRDHLRSVLWRSGSRRSVPNIPTRSEAWVTLVF